MIPPTRANEAMDDLPRVREIASLREDVERLEAEIERTRDPMYLRFRDEFLRSEIDRMVDAMLYCGEAERTFYLHVLRYLRSIMDRNKDLTEFLRDATDRIKMLEPDHA